MNQATFEASAEAQFTPSGRQLIIHLVSPNEEEQLITFDIRYLSALLAALQDVSETLYGSTGTRSQSFRRDEQREWGFEPEADDEEQA